MTDARRTLADIGMEQGWDLDAMLAVACAYIDNQDDPLAFWDHVKRRAREENEEAQRFMEEG